MLQNQGEKKIKIKFVVYTAISNNLGDNAQAYALCQLFRYMDIPESDIIIVNRHNILEKIENDVMYILPCSMSAVNYYDIIEYLLEAGRCEQFVFLPISIGLIRNTFGDDFHFGKANWLSDKFVQPIGCRDYDSQLMYEKQGYSTYVYGCITSILPKRDGEKKYNKIYLYDVPQNFYPYIPERIKNGAEPLTKTINGVLPSPGKLWELCIERYELLRDTAKLVITVNYHVAVPCAAMGIPVIMVDNCNERGFRWSNDTRLPALNPTIPYYTKEQWQCIDWEPKIAEFEHLKTDMIELAVSRIKNAVTIIKSTYTIAEALKPSRQRFLDICNKNIGNVDIMGFDEFLGDKYLSKLKDNFQFYLYGLSDRYVEQEECILLEYIQRRFPKAEFLGFVDSKKTGIYFGKEVISPEKLEIDENTYCLVAAYTANDFAEQLFESQGFDKTHLWQMPEHVLFYIYHL